MRKYITYLELLQMVKEGKQPQKVWFEAIRFEWDSNGRRYYSAKTSMVWYLPHELNDFDLTVEACLSYEVPILDEREKQFIREVMVPMRVEEVMKNICITYRGDEERLSYRRNPNFIHVLPPFEKGTMYKGMEPGRWYSIEELLEE